MIQSLVDCQKALEQLVAVLKPAKPVEPIEVERSLPISNSTAKMEAVKIESFTRSEEYYLKTDLAREVYWLVTDCEKSSNGYRVVARNHLGSMAIATLKPTDKLYKPVIEVEVVTPEVEALPVETEKLTKVESQPEIENNKTIRVERKRKGFKVTVGSYQLTAYGVKNTELWVKGSDGVYREKFNWQVIQNILENCVLDSLIELRHAYNVYALCTARAIASGVSQKSLQEWWSALSDLVEVPVSLKGLVKA